MSKPLKAYHIERVRGHLFQIWSELTPEQIRAVDGVTFVDEHGFFEIDPRYGEEDVLTEIKRLATECFEAEPLEVHYEEDQ
jgi:hypothetical protein